MSNNYSHWLPAAFCASVALIAILTGLAQSFIGTGTSLSGADIVVYCFVPMCFVFVAGCTSRRQRENQDLQNRIEQLRDDFIARA